MFGLPNYVESLFRPEVFFTGETCPPDSIHAAFAVASGTAHICVGDTVHFQDLSTVHPEAVERWDWHFDDPASGMLDSSALQHPVHVFTAPGLYTVSLIAGIRLTPISCKSDTSSMTIEVRDCVIGIPETGPHGPSIRSPEAALQALQQQAWPAGSLLTLRDAAGRVYIHADAATVLPQLQRWYSSCADGIYICTLSLPTARHTAKWMMLR
jgi:hypothetical protein